MDKKYIISIVFIFAAIIGFSQSIALIEGGENLENGQEVVFIGDHTLPDMAIELAVTNTSSSTKDISCVRYELDSIPASALYMCWANCTVLPSGGTVSLGPGETSDLFSAHINPNNHFGIERSLYTFFDQNNPSDSMSFIATFTTTSFLLKDEEDQVMIYPEIELWGTVNGIIEYQLPQLINIGDEDLNIVIEQEIISLAEGAGIGFEWNGIYYEDENLSQINIIEVLQSDASFKAHFSAGNILGISIIKYTFFEEDMEENAHAITLIFNSTSVGIENMEAVPSFAFPNPSQGFINIQYEIPSVSIEAKLQVIDLLGSLIEEIHIDPKKDQIQLHLPSGQYYYRIISDLGYSHTTKLLVL